MAIDRVNSIGDNPNQALLSAPLPPTFTKEELLQRTYTLLKLLPHDQAPTNDLRYLAAAVIPAALGNGVFGYYATQAGLKESDFVIEALEQLGLPLTEVSRIVYASSTAVLETALEAISLQMISQLVMPVKLVKQLLKKIPNLACCNPYITRLIIIAILTLTLLPLNSWAAYEITFDFVSTPILDDTCALVRIATDTIGVLSVVTRAIELVYQGARSSIDTISYYLGCYPENKPDVYTNAQLTTALQHINTSDSDVITYLCHPYDITLTSEQENALKEEITTQLIAVSHPAFSWKKLAVLLSYMIMIPATAVTFYTFYSGGLKAGREQPDAITDEPYLEPTGTLTNTEFSIAETFRALCYGTGAAASCFVFIPQFFIQEIGALLAEIRDLITQGHRWWRLIKLIGRVGMLVTALFAAIFPTIAILEILERYGDDDFAEGLYPKENLSIGTMALLAYSVISLSKYFYSFCSTSYSKQLDLQGLQEQLEYVRELLYHVQAEQTADEPVIEEV